MTTLEIRRDDVLSLLAFPADALAFPVHCGGFLGHGLALRAKRQFPELQRAYDTALGNKSLVPGRVLPVPIGKGGRTIVLVATRLGPEPPVIDRGRQVQHRKNLPPPRREDVATLATVGAALTDLGAWLGKTHAISSIALAPLGCGVREPGWKRVLPLLERLAADHPSVRIVAFAPEWDAAAAETPSPALAPAPSDR